MDSTFHRRSKLLRVHIWYAAAFLVFVTSLVSCNAPLESKEYLQWVEDSDNGLRVRKNYGQFHFDVQYLPLNYRRIKLQQEALQQDSLQYYSLTIGCNDMTDLLRRDAAGQEEVQRRIYYFSYLFQHDLFLEEDGRTYPCVLYHFQQSLNADKSRTFLLAFERKEVTEEATLVVESSLFDSLPLKFKLLRTDRTLTQL